MVSLMSKKEQMENELKRHRFSNKDCECSPAFYHAKESNQSFYNYLPQNGILNPDKKKKLTSFLT